jgi:peptide/nickel transport system substrate-binding protein
MLLIGAVVLGLAAVLPSIGAETQAEKRELRVSFAWPTFIDPAVGSDFSSSSSFTNLYDSLVYPTSDGDVIPAVAERWETSADGLSWTFYLRRGIKFHDGKELTAEDIAFSLKRLTTIGEGYAFLFLDKIESTEVLDDYTVQFKLSQPFGPFLITLPRLYILNEECVTEHIETPGPYGEFGDYGKDYLLTHDCGSGPYQVKEMRTEEFLVMEKVQDYWAQSLSDVPDLLKVQSNAPDEVKFIGTTEPVTIRTMMARRELEISDQWQPNEGWKALDEINGVDIASFFPGTSFYLMLHTRKPPTDDIHFRKAIAWAFDYATVVEQIFPGSRQAFGPVAATVPGHKDTFQYRRDLEKAREELQQSRYFSELKDYPVEFHWIAEVPDEEKVALLFQANMAELGIQVNVVKVPWLSVVEEMASQETSPNIVSIFVAPHYPEAGSILESRYHSKSAATWEQNEWLLDPEIDQMLEDSIATIDRTERFDKYGQIQDRIVELSPSLFLFDQVEKHAYQACYVAWPAAQGAFIPVMGYNMDARRIQVYPERRGSC